MTTPAVAPVRPDPAERTDPAPQRFVVTGSLIERATSTTPSPVTIVPREQLLWSGRSMLGDALQALPEQGNAINAQNNNGGDGSTRINLRSLGIDHTLVLLNGRRVVPVGLGGDVAFDTNTIPLAVIDHVEILKDAGSAVYGSEAIAGVVNIVTRTNFTGVETSLFTEETERGDGFNFDASMVAGVASKDGKAHIVFAAGFQKQDAVSAADREFSRTTSTLDFETGVATLAGSSATPTGRLNTTGLANGKSICGAMFCTADGHGGFRPFLTPQDLYNFQLLNLIYTPSTRATAYSAGEIEIRPHTNAFFETSFTRRDSEQQLAEFPLNTSAEGIVISRDSIYNPLGVDITDFNRRLVEFGPRRFDEAVDTFRAVAGVKGTIGNDSPLLPDWKWELSLNYGRTDSTETQTGNPILSRLSDALGPSFIDPTNGPTCGTPTAPIAGCVPLNLLAGKASPAAVAAATYTALSSGTDLEQMALATLTGQVARFPGGGDVSIALSADARRETSQLVPDSLSAAGDSTINTQSAINGSTSVAETAAELSVVPVRDADGAERLELDLAARAFHYDSFGDGTSWTARALARPVRGLTLRASASNAFRAPSVADLFTAQSNSFTLARDPCDQAFVPPGVAATVNPECTREGVPAGARFGTSQQPITNGGNPALSPETAKVASAGVVLEPLRGLTLSADYWRIEVDQQIQALQPQIILNGCYNDGIESFCDLVHRDPMTHAISFIDDRNTNVGGMSTAGLDAAATLDLGPLWARFEAQRLDKFDVVTPTATLHGVGVYDLGIHPRLQANLTAALRSGGATIGTNVHFVGSSIECAQDDCNDDASSPHQIPSYEKVDLFTSITFTQHGHKTTLSAGVNNVFDVQPPTIFNGAAGNYDESAYDFLGRMFWLRVSSRY